MLMWPVTMSHRIDSDSPLYRLKPQDLHQSGKKFEILVVLEGVTEETGNSIQVRNSYLPNEILWGHHFSDDCIEYDAKKGNYAIHHER